MIGATVAGYRIEELIGRGGMSRVYRAEHLRLGRRDALKVLAPELLADATFRDRFEREWRVAAGIEHPNIIPVYDAGEANGHFYIAMRYVETTDLRALLKRDGPLPPARGAHIVRQAASALDAAHRRGLVHRDIKPGNILVADGDHVYLSDFGLAKSTTADKALTRSGHFLGTVGYAAPEQIHGSALDARTDVYGLACLTYECLSGAWPYERESEAEIMQAHLEAPPPRLSAARPDLPGEVDEVIARGLAKAKEDRYASCGAFASALQACLPNGRPAAEARRAPRTVFAEAARKRPDRRWWLAAAGALLLVVAAFALAAALGGDDAGDETQTTPSRGAGPIFSDGFAAPGRGWYDYESDAVRLGYRQGRYEIAIKVPNRRAYADTGFSPAAADLGDVAVAVNASALTQVPSAFGLLCRIGGRSTYYGLLLGTRGTVRAVKVVGGASTVLRTTRIDPPSGETRLRGECSGGREGTPVTLTLIADGRRILRARDTSKPLPTGATGLVAESFDRGGARVAFDDFVVRRAS
jgi:tRNA A-37 threonylcarbamoyl transferase component Bud32